jgi:hypothetical protein
MYFTVIIHDYFLTIQGQFLERNPFTQITSSPNGYGPSLRSIKHLIPFLMLTNPLRMKGCSAHANDGMKSPGVAFAFVSFARKDNGIPICRLPPIVINPYPLGYSTGKKRCNPTLFFLCHVFFTQTVIGKPRESYFR